MPLTSKIFEELIEKILDRRLKPLFELILESHKTNQAQFKKMNVKIDKSQEHVDWFIGKYTKLDEEHDVIANQVSKHSDRIENLETKVFGSIQT